MAPVQVFKSMVVGACAAIVLSLAAPVSVTAFSPSPPVASAPSAKQGACFSGIGAIPARVRRKNHRDARPSVVALRAFFGGGGKKKKETEAAEPPKPLASQITDKRRQQLGIADDEDEYDLGVALAANTDDTISKIVAGSFILVVIGLLVAGVVIPSITDYGEGVCSPIQNAGRC